MNNQEPTEQEKWLCVMKERYPHMLQRIRWASVGIGWLPLLENLFEEVHRRESVIISEGRRVITLKEAERLNPQEYEAVYVKVQFVQIKEKFGGLRAYFESGNDNGIRHLIEKAETNSYKTCEDCGTVETTKQRNMRGWIHTFCENCSDNWFDRRAKELLAKK